MASAGGPPDPEEYVTRSGVRSGLKGDFAFALRSLAQLPVSLRRTFSGESSSAPRESKRPRKSGGDLAVKAVESETWAGSAAAPIVLDCDDEPMYIDGFGESASEAAPSQVKPIKAPVLVDCDDDLIVDVPSAKGAAVATLMFVNGCGESMAEAAPLQVLPVKTPIFMDCDDEPKATVVPLANGAILESLGLVDGRGETEAALSQVKPIDDPVVVGRDNEPMVDILQWKNGAAVETLVLVDSDDEFAAEAANQQVEPTKVFVRSPSRGNVGDLVKSPSRPVHAFGSATDTVIVLDDDATCKSNGGSLDNGGSMENLVVTDFNNGFNRDELEDKSFLASAAPTLRKDRESLQGPPTKVEYRDGLPQKPMKRFARPLLKVPVAEMESPAAVISAMGNGHDSFMHDGTFTMQPCRRFTRSSIKVEEDSVTIVGAGPSSESTGSVGTKGRANPLNGSLSSTPKNKMELKKSKKISLTRLPSNVRDLLSTGLLEGFPVKYILSNGKQIELQGVIKGNGILCSCATCDSSTVVSVYVFEQHASSTKKHSAKFIYLENGKSLQDIVKACRGATLDMLESAIQGALGPLHPQKCFTCQNCEVSFSTSRAGKFALFCDSCLESKQLLRTPIHLNENVSSARLSRTSFTPETSFSSSKNLSSNKKSGLGRLTRKDLGLHKLVFMNGILPEGTEVGYYVCGKRLLEGNIKNSGIFCCCCNTVVSPSQFEAHAGRAAHRKPYNNIYISNGVSLHELSVSLSKDRKLSVSENDDLCSICADGGDLLLCDLCPRAFHKACVGLSSIPEGDWYCQYCINLHQRERSVACNDNAIAAGRVAGVDPIEQIFKRCIRIVTISQTDVGGCAICRSHDFSKSRFDERTVMICDQCEKEYHVGCLREQNLADLKELPEGEWFCCTYCSRIWAALQEFLLHGAQLLPMLDADLIKKKLENKGVNMDADVDISWRLLSGKTATADNKLLLSSAVAIFHESFDPIIEPRTGRDLIPSMVYGRSVRDQDFGGMFCAILTVGSSVVSAGILRVLGSEIAELPLVATSREHQGQGYFQSLFLCIERLLGSLKVKHFLLPAADEAESIWTKKFGFAKITSDQLQKFLKGSRTTVFQGTSMLHKPVPLIEVSSQGDLMANSRQ